MRFVRWLVVQLCLAMSLPAAVSWLVAARLFPLSAEQERIRAAVPLALLVVAAATLAVLRSLVLPIRRVVDRLPDAPAEERARATLAAMRLPYRLSGAVLGLSAALVIAIVAAELVAGLAPDIAAAGAAVGAAFGTMAAMFAYSVAATSLAPVIEKLGPAEVGERGTFRGKILVLCYGTLAIATLLVGSLTYARYRTDSDAAHVAAAARALDEAAQVARGDGPEKGVAFALRAYGAPTVALGPDGAVLARAGSAPAAAVVPGAAAVEAIHGGWLLRRQAGGATLVSFVSEGPLLARRRQFWGSAAIVGLVVFASAALLVWIAAKSLAAPIRSLGRIADRVAAGDLTVSPASVTRDELGALAADFRRMTHGLAALVVDVQSATRGVHEGSREVRDIGDRVRAGALEEHDGVVAVTAAVEAMQQSVALVARGVEGLGDYVSTTSSVVGEMSAALGEVRRQAGELTRTVDGASADVERASQSGRRAQQQLAVLDDLATTAGGSLGALSSSLTELRAAADESESTAAHVVMMADASEIVVEEAVAGIEGLRTAVDDAKRRVGVLGRRSDDVQKILEFIGDVAGRTNLLSLNASIIATQAGEHGRAFSVVAEQIRELAAQIASSTKSIENIIRAVRDDVDGTARLIDRTDDLAADGVALARKSLSALHDIRDATARARETAAAIQSAVEAHVASSGSVAQLVTSVAENSRSVADAIQGVGRSVGAVHTVSRAVGALAERVSRALEDQSGLGRRQLEGLERIDARLAEISRALESHEAATRHVRELLVSLARTAAQHESAVAELAGVAERLGGRSRALAERVDRFKV